MPSLFCYLWVEISLLRIIELDDVWIAFFLNIWLWSVFTEYHFDLCFNKSKSFNIFDGGGVIESGSDVKNYYGENLDCTITLTASDGRKILITWEDFNIEGNSNDDCDDTLKIYSGTSASGVPLNTNYCGDFEITEFCGATRPLPGYPDIVSKGNSLTFHLKTDSHGASNSFKFVYTSFSTAGKYIDN